MSTISTPRRSYRQQPPPHRRSKSEQSPDSPAVNLSTRGWVVVFTIVAVVAVALGAGVWRMLTGQRLDPVFFQDSLVSVGGGDLPAPPFIGWEQKTIDTPPEPLEENPTISEVNLADCTPGGFFHNELAGLITHNATRWSGTEMYNAAYNAQIRVDLSDSFQQNNDRNGGEFLAVVDRWLQECSYVEFNQQLEAGQKTVRITYEALPADMPAWGLSDGRAWVQTVATTSAERFEGITTTIWSLGYGFGATVQAQLTFEGHVDDTAVNTMDMLWTSQISKLKDQN